MNETKRYAYYPGCSLHASAKEYDMSFKAIAPRLGIELIEIPEWTCCTATPGYTVDPLTGHALVARNLAIIEQLDSIRIPSPEIAEWLRNTLKEAFEDAACARRQWHETLAKRKSELVNMRERLFNGYLSGVVEESAFQAKSLELKREIEDVEKQMEEAGKYDPKRKELALSVFDFSQNLANLWHGSNFAVRREILECVSSNRLLSDVSLVLTKRKPFDFLAERPFLKDGRGDWI